MIKKIPILLTLIILISCEDYKDRQEERRIKSWIKDTMEEVYLWEEFIPDGLDIKDGSEPKDFFKKFIYEDDYWSWISDDYYETSELLDGITTTAGYQFYLAYRKDAFSIVGVIEYCMPNSPAEKAGITRGDIFTRINNTNLNKDNYYSLLTQGGEYTIGFDTISDNTLLPYKDVEISEVESFQEDPIYLDTIYHIGGKNIGYLVYNSFIDKYNSDLDIVFSQYKSEGISDFIIDLRYNSGGDVSAQKYLANLIAPKSALGEIFSKDHWNELYTDYFMDEKGRDFFYSYITSSPSNIDLEGKFCGLTSSSSASASEGLLNGLEPLLDLTLIGDTTHGKYTGMIVIPDDEDNPQWALVPIVVKTTNKNDISVKGGMAPNILLDDNPLDGYQLGDIRETMLAKAIEEITGMPIVKSARLQSNIINQSFGSFKDGKKIQAKPRIIDYQISTHFSNP